MKNLDQHDTPKHGETSLLGEQFWENATGHAQQLAASEGQALITRPTGQLPRSSAQSPSKNLVQTTVTSSSEKGSKNSHFQLSQLASFNSLRLRSIVHPSPAGTDTTTSPTKSQKSPKKGSLHLPKLPSFKTLSLKRRGPILASTSGIVQVEKTTRPSILSPSTFLPLEPPKSPIPPIPKAPRPAFRSLYRGPSATYMDIAPPTTSDSVPPSTTVAPGYLSRASFQEWLDRESDTQPEIETPPHSTHSSRISLMACLNKGGSWDNIPRTKSVLKLNMFFDAIKVHPKNPVDLDDDQTTEKGAMTDKVTMVDKATMTNFDNEGSATDPTSPTTNTTTMVGGAIDTFYETATDDQETDHSAEEPEDEIVITILSLEQVRPLGEFRNLRVLKLTGMMKSYQPIIWQTVWVNPQLTILELEMAVGLEINKPLGPSEWKAIEKGWVMSVKSCATPVYYGYNGNGEIWHRIGYGEYLDKFCIERAKVVALSSGFPVPSYLPVKYLTLTGFAVDGDPFGVWFRNLEEVHFKKDCIDCGFWLSRAQRNVRVRHSNEYGVARGADGPSEAGSIVELGEEALAELTAAVKGLGVLRK
ncbi:uncharacterized protein N7500_000016 [Penicillium coprophilum]|uniref:uncharacterized protein n=1 Tax=Penicillium coprophilum TaxID=36646 RepID=UPI00238A976C|nr:uncharacterized protein N7500_000016 [Penicillium coprophilum]KAJ5177317.1 hypothetical protein N7500_000016 [Penicillium coprophilum]